MKCSSRYSPVCMGMILLIFGILFLLGTTGIWPEFTFTKYWPLVLIIFGLHNLVCPCCRHACDSGDCEGGHCASGDACCKGGECDSEKSKVKTGEVKVKEMAAVTPKMTQPAKAKKSAPSPKKSSGAKKTAAKKKSTKKKK